MSDLVPTTPEFAQRAITELKEQQRLTVEQTKLTGLQVVADMTSWASKVLTGEKKVYGYTMKGEKYEEDPHQYLLEHADKLKSLAATMETLGGKQEQRNQVYVAILGRGKQQPRKLTAEEARTVEVVEEIVEE